ncbi:hypothetical protein NKH14_16375 [Mesorhizobium sp. M1380]|uniref:alpha/beta hydrolase family protein n=1 Tax=Mesorhizobium sp. M1380 TaxID=2957093 RepID=UPI00333991D9
MHGDSEAVLFRFSSFQVAGVAWSSTGKCLVAFHGPYLLVRDGVTGIALRHMECDVKRIEFLKTKLVCLLSDNTLVIESCEGENCGERIGEVRDFVVASDAIWIHRESDRKNWIEHRTESQTQKLDWPFEHSRNASISCSPDGQHLLCSIWERIDQRNGRMMIASLNAYDERWSYLLDTVFHLGISAPLLSVAVDNTGCALLAFEKIGSTRIWQVSRGNQPFALTNESYEIIEFAISPDGMAVAAIALEAGHGTLGASNVLLFGRRVQDGWVISNKVIGSFDMLRWRTDGILCCATASSEGWSLIAIDPNLAELPSIARCHSHLQNVGEFDLFHIAGPPKSSRSIIIIASPHRHLRQGPQPLFFQHALYGAGLELARAGMRVVGMNGPGSWGGGEQRRCPPEPLPVRWAAAFMDAVALLNSQGSDFVGLLAGSLGAFVAVNAIRMKSSFSAAALVSPILTTPIGNLQKWDDILRGPDHGTNEGTKLPLFVAYGAADELMQQDRVTALLRELSDERGSCGLSLPGEGHIFRDPQSWLTVVDRAVRFFAESAVAR